MFELWKDLHSAPYHFPMGKAVWEASMYHDVDGDGRTLFSELHTDRSDHGMIQYGYSAFGFDQEGEISDKIHYPIIRMLAFDPDYPQEGKALLENAMLFFAGAPRVYAFFHYFGMSACARHGKIHESDRHVAKMLEENGFIVEHENVYYMRILTDEGADQHITLNWKDLSPGGCREFAAIKDGQAFGWGQVHFLPQKEIAYLRWIYIDEIQQHTGLGTAVMKELFHQLHDMGIRRFDTDTARNNATAQGFYEKTGFTNCGITRSYFTR